MTKHEPTYLGFVEQALFKKSLNKATTKEESNTELLNKVIKHLENIEKAVTPVMLSEPLVASTECDKLNIVLERLKNVEDKLDAHVSRTEPQKTHFIM